MWVCWDALTTLYMCNSRLNYLDLRLHRIFLDSNDLGCRGSDHPFDLQPQEVEVSFCISLRFEDKFRDTLIENRA